MGAHTIAGGSNGSRELSPLTLTTVHAHVGPSNALHLPINNNNS